jgi:hypothetical protein
MFVIVSASSLVGCGQPEAIVQLSHPDQHVENGDRTVVLLPAAGEGEGEGEGEGAVVSGCGSIAEVPPDGTIYNATQQPVDGYPEFLAFPQAQSFPEDTLVPELYLLRMMAHSAGWNNDACIPVSLTSFTFDVTLNWNTIWNWPDPQIEVQSAGFPVGQLTLLSQQDNGLVAQPGGAEVWTQLAFQWTGEASLVTDALYQSLDIACTNCNAFVLGQVYDTAIATDQPISYRLDGDTQDIRMVPPVLEQFLLVTE